MLNPRVSTIIPTFNCAATLPAAIDSALAQEFDRHEIIVVNDGSTDDTAAILARYGDRIRTIEQSNMGFNRARNVAIKIARGDYFAFLDADDIWLPGRVARTCAALDRNPAAVLAFTEVIPMDERGELGPPWIVGAAPTLSDLLTRGWRIYPSAVTMRRSIYLAAGGFSEELTNLSDCYLWMRAREFGPFEYLTEPLTVYRTIDFGRIGDKYGVGYKRFARAVRRRYGRAAKPFVRSLAEVFSSSLITKAVTQTERGERLSACTTFARAAWISPRYVIRSGLVRRLVSRRNLRRTIGTAKPSSSTRA